MKKIVLVMLPFMCLAAVATLAQNADSIIAKHLEAIGGKSKISSITSMKMLTTSSLMGNDNDATITILNGKGYKLETVFNGQPIVSAINSAGGWGINGMTGNTDPQKMQDEQYGATKDQMNIGSPFINYPANGYKAEYTGIDTSNNTKAYKIKLTTPGGIIITDYFDPATYYLLKTEIAAGDKETSVVYSDYRKTDIGFVMPFSLETTLPQGFSIVSKVNTVKFNEPVDPKIFEMP